MPLCRRTSREGIGVKPACCWLFSGGLCRIGARRRMGGMRVMDSGCVFCCETRPYSALPQGCPIGRFAWATIFVCSHKRRLVHEHTIDFARNNTCWVSTAIVHLRGRCAIDLKNPCVHDIVVLIQAKGLVRHRILGPGPR